MGSFPYDKEFLPVVQAGDYIEFLTPISHSHDGTQYQVTQVEPLQPFLFDWLQISGILAKNATTLAAGQASNQVSVETMRNIFETDKNIFAQWRVDLIDDFLLELDSPGQSHLWATAANLQTLISTRLPRHKPQTTLTTINATDVLLWANTVNALLAGNAVNQTPTRKSRLIGLAVSSDGATNIFFGDAAAAGGTEASFGTALFEIQFSAADFIFYGADDLPDGLIFDNGIVVEQTAMQNTTILAIVEESNTGVFGGQLINQERAIANQNNEFYSFGLEVPGSRVYNPLNTINIATALSMIAGYQFAIKQQGAPAGARVIKIPLESVTHAGIPSN